jgi:hypothetical protein
MTTETDGAVKPASPYTAPIVAFIVADKSAADTCPKDVVTPEASTVECSGMKMVYEASICVAEAEAELADMLNSLLFPDKPSSV